MAFKFIVDNNTCNLKILKLNIFNSNFNNNLINKN